MARVRLLDVGDLAAVSQSLAAELPQRLQHSVADRLPAIVDREHRLVYERGHGANEIIASHAGQGHTHALRGTQSEPTYEDRCLLEHSSLELLEQVVGPLNCGLQGAVSGETSAPALAEQRKTPIEPAIHLDGSHRRGPRRGELDR